MPSNTGTIPSSPLRVSPLSMASPTRFRITGVPEAILTPAHSELAPGHVSGSVDGQYFAPNPAANMTFPSRDPCCMCAVHARVGGDLGRTRLCRGNQFCRTFVGPYRADHRVRTAHTRRFVDFPSPATAHATGKNAANFVLLRKAFRWYERPASEFRTRADAQVQSLTTSSFTTSPAWDTTRRTSVTARVSGEIAGGEGAISGSYLWTTRAVADHSPCPFGSENHAAADHPRGPRQ